MSSGGAWATAAALGAFHGLNPAMGWLFAVALGLQEKRRGAVLAALVPIALGHAASVAIVALALAGLGLTVPPRSLRLASAGILIAFGLFRLARPFAHPRWVGMRVGFRDLVLWSFLMASAHGAGLMLAPVFLGGMTELPPNGLTHGHAHLPMDAGIVAVHTAAMLLVMGAIALAVYQTLGLAILRRAWINVDLLWAGALIAVGVAMLVQAIVMHG
ncbi:MAG TPA: hypothetical protein VFS33_01525 [Gemmatimonadales bacterium]|nr:hypothetical protein [Gemmatimonadales bacterium]